MNCKAMAGATYRVSPSATIFLIVDALVLIIFAFATSRWLTLISTGREFAKTRGLNVPKTLMLLLCCVGLLYRGLTASMGPVAFVGLLAPHISVILGAKKVQLQLSTAAIIGAVLMVLFDWIGQNIVYPSQIVAGTVVSVVGLYFIFLLLMASAQGVNDT